MVPKVYEEDEQYKNALAKNTADVKEAGNALNNAVDESLATQKQGFGTQKKAYDDAADWENPGSEDLKKSAGESVKAYDTIINENKPLTKEEQARIRKRRKSSALWSAIGDGISAIASLGSTINYGQPFKADKTMSERMRERWKELDAERKEKQDLYLNALGKKNDALKDVYNQHRAEHNDKLAATLGGANVNIELGKAQADAAKTKYGTARDTAGIEAENAGKAHKVGQDRESFEETKRANKVSEGQRQQSINLEAQKYKDAKEQEKDTITVNTGDKDEVLTFDKRTKGALISYAKDALGDSYSLIPIDKDDEDYLTDLKTAARKNADISKRVKGIIKDGYYKESDTDFSEYIVEE